MKNTDQTLANGVETPSKTSSPKTYTEQQVLSLLALKDQTIRWLNCERINLQTEVKTLETKAEKINQALNLIQSLTDSYMDLAVFERLKLH